MSPSLSPSFAAYLHALARPRRGGLPGLSAAGLSRCGCIVEGLEPTIIVYEIIHQWSKFGKKHPPAPISSSYPINMVFQMLDGKERHWSIILVN